MQERNPTDAAIITSGLKTDLPDRMFAFAVPRSIKNLSFFAAASRKIKGTYKTEPVSHASKPKWACQSSPRTR